MALPTARTFVPQGFVAGRHPMVSEALARRLDMLGRRAPPQRVLALRAGGAKAGACEEFFAERPHWGARLKAPGAWEVEIAPDDIAQVTARRDLFRWVDVATRLFGAVAADPNATVAVRIAARGGDTKGAEAALREAGGTATGRGEGAVEGKLAAGKAADLLRAAAVEAVEILG